jgi:hypothetical protein
MFARITKAFSLTQDEKAVVWAYLVFSLMTTGTGYAVLSRTGPLSGFGAGGGLYESWMLVATALAAGVSLFIARGWIGMPGMLGALRAAVGACVLLFLITLIAGTLILPAYGTFYAPFLVLTAFMETPALAVVWCGGVFVAHRLLAHASAARLALQAQLEQRAQSSLSPLSQAYFYRK